MFPHRAIIGGDWRRSLALAVLVSVLGLTGADAQAQSLGELAAREAARRAAIKVPARVYSNAPRRDPVRVPTSVSPAPAPVAPAPPPSLPQTAPVLPAVLEIRVTPSNVQKPVPAAVPNRNSVLRPIEFSATPAPAPAPENTNAARTALPASLTGWSAFQIKKTKAEMTETARLADTLPLASRTGPDDVRLPPQRDVLRLSTGIGYLQGADLGGDISGSGKINGMQTDLSAFFTAGAMGFESRNGRVSIFSPGGKWRGEGGDLYSDLRGLARGARVTLGAGRRWTPSVSVYFSPRALASSAATVMAYRDRLQVLARVGVAGEVTSDGAAFVQGHYGHPRLDLTAFYRVTRAPIAGHDKGVSAGVSVGGGVAVSGAIRLSDAVGDSSQWQMASVRLPLIKQTSVTLERAWWSGSLEDGSTTAVALQVSLGPVRMTQRVQWGRTDYWQRPMPFGFDRRVSQSSASYTPGLWGSMNYQQSTQWSDAGRMQLWDEVSSSFQIGRRTSVHVVTAFPELWEPQRLRLRVRQQLSPTLQLEAQYGRLSAFQLTRAPEREESRTMLTIRKTWQIESPSRGGEVRGQAIDQLGAVVPGALVRLGPYSAITDAAGGYSFTRVPDGDFELALDRNKLPAAYAWDQLPRAVTVAGGSRVNIDLEVSPLNAISGRVFIDRNNNGLFDEDEGVPNVVMRIDDAVTATSATGSYAFYNQPPGRYTIHLDVTRLIKGLAPVSPADREIDLTGQGPLVGINFTLEKKDMPIIMRKIPR